MKTRYHSFRQETLEHRRLLSSNGFVTHEIARSDFASNSTAIFVDFDRDGDQDVVSRASWSADYSSKVTTAISLHENVDGRGLFGPRQVLATRQEERWYSEDSVAVLDLDNDTDLDLLVSTAEHGLYWHQNVEGIFSNAMDLTPAFDTSHLIDLKKMADFNGDSVADVLSVNTLFDDEQSRFFFELQWSPRQENSPTFSESNVIAVFSELGTFEPTDFDSDGDIDIVVSGERTALLLNDGSGIFTATDLNVDFPAAIIMPTDLDHDGDQDLILARPNSEPDFTVVAMFRNDLGKFLLQEQIELMGESEGFTILDLDGDGTDDPVSAGAVMEWVPIRIGDQFSFGESQTIFPRINVEFKDTGDIDQDGDLDLLIADGVQLMTVRVDSADISVEPLSTGHSDVEAAIGDLDGDGDVDFASVSGSGVPVRWHENVDGSGSFVEHPIVAIDSQIRVSDIRLGDVDGDGDSDIVVAGISGMYWFRNDGDKQFSQTLLISDSRFSKLAELIDIDGDSDVDVISLERSDITVYFNEDGLGDFGTPKSIHSFGRRISVSSASFEDIDGDGVTDLITRQFREGLLWYPGMPNELEFGAGRVITSNRPNDVVFDDVDADGDLDILTANLSEIQLLTNNRGQTESRFDPPVVVWEDGSNQYVADLFASDMDHDGDRDLLFGQYERGAFLLENVNGLYAAARPFALADDSFAAPNINVADFDSDGDNDILLAASLARPIVPLVWFESRPIGDVNDDGEFNSTDLVEVFQAGEYEDNIQGNSTFLEGDWNGDGDFNSTDFVFAFQSGSYIAAAFSNQRILALGKVPTSNLIEPHR